MDLSNKEKDDPLRSDLKRVFCWNFMKEFGAWIWKWFVCSWFHRKHRCYPTVWGKEQADKMGIPYRPNAWHCHPCGEIFDIWRREGII